MLAIADDQLDLHRFERLAEDGSNGLAIGAAARALRSALAIWRGPAFADLEEPFARGERARLEELRLHALEDRIEADMQLGRHADVVAELEALVREHPQRESLSHQLMLAARSMLAMATWRQRWWRPGVQSKSRSWRARPLISRLL